MMRWTGISIALAALALGTAADHAGNTVPDAIPDGKPRECLPVTQIRDSTVRSDQVIDFRVGNQVYRNTLDQPCPELGFEQRYEHKTTISQICSTDTITVLRDLGGLQRGATCGLGMFQPVKLVKR